MLISRKSTEKLIKLRPIRNNTKASANILNACAIIILAMTSTIVSSSTIQQKLSEMATHLERAGQLARELSQLGSADTAQTIPEDQEWFWSEEWQAGEREVDEQFARGEYMQFDTVEEAIAYLDKQV